MTIKSTAQFPRARQLPPSSQLPRKATTREPLERYEPGFSDHLHSLGGRMLMGLPGATMGGIAAAGVGFVNTAPFLGLSTGLKVAGVLGCLGAAGGAWVSSQLAGMD